MAPTVHQQKNNAEIDAFLALIEDICEEKTMPANIEERLEEALQSDRLGLCEEAASPFDEA